ncbi:thiol reductant ABC exporter subunit CydC [Phycicoccus sp. M110.8]|uniref:thiol reductant ABC exporter subunit CydC n=1 Tax=Phycicoccus sp. M110.8 TaxID=3075433 RepID=UPI0028FD1961|nr:thiol reductant ABC exporter subunit CydC [Phycicoccus sp. M110.8]MDU0313817.1 thiol reductant ABC exporter subunit CydC [Phycicoccus sp. M110.8]
MRLFTPRIVLAGVLGAAALSSGVALTATSGWLIVRASERPVILTLLTAIVAVRTFGIARPVFRYAERLRSHDAALDELATERTRLYAALVPLTPARLVRRGRAAMLSGVVDDLTDRVEAQVRVAVPFVATAVTGVLTAVLCGVVEPWAGVAVAGLLLVAAATTTVAWLVEERGHDDLVRARADATATAELTASQALDLAAVGAGASALGWLGEAHDSLAAAVRRQSRGRAGAAAAIPVATAVATLVAALVATGSDRPTPVLALVVLAPFALAEVLSPLPDAARALASARAAGRRLDALTDEAPAVAAAAVDASAVAGSGLATGGATGDATDEDGASASRTVPPRLRLSGVTASWDGHRRAVGPVDLDLAPGSVVALTGPSGCGKSTALAVLARQLDPQDGSYTVDGADALALPLAEVRSLFAVVDDEPHVFATTLRENLRLARPGATDAEVAAALDAAGLRDWRTGLADGLDTRLGSGGRGLSGGERARLSIARALLSKRPVLLLDEPVAHLDHPTAVAVLEDLLAARGNRTVVVVSHRPEGLSGADGIIDLGARVPAVTGG